MLSFSLDFSPIFDMASQFVSGIFPVFLIPLGITLGIGILSYISKSFRGLFHF